MILLAYGLSNALRLASYAPQIWRIAHDAHGAQAISCLTWNLWIAANGCTALYAWTQLSDLPLTVMHIGNALCCAAVVLLTCFKRALLCRQARPACTAPKETVMTLPIPLPPIASQAVRRPARLYAAVVLCTIISLGGLLTWRPPNAGVTTPQKTGAAQAAPVPTPLPARDAGVDWQRVEPSEDVPGAAIAAYEP